MEDIPGELLPSYQGAFDEDLGYSCTTDLLVASKVVGLHS